MGERSRIWGLRGCLPYSVLGLSSPLLQAVQSIGNLGQQLGQGKEQWLAPLHPFLLQSISRVRDFLDQLVDVDKDEGESCSPATPGLSPTPTPQEYSASHSLSPQY